jgi:HEAT repeat protein
MGKNEKPNSIDSLSTKELIDLALTEKDEEKSWASVVALHRRGTSEVLEQASVLLKSRIPKQRKLGVDILGQLGFRTKIHYKTCFDRLADLLAKEKSPAVLGAIGVAMGHLADKRAVKLLPKFANHKSPAVRRGITFGLMGHEDSVAIKCLIKFSRDKNSDIRDWATFGIGTQIDADNEPIRRALKARLHDRHEYIQNEAILGLAKRGDLTVKPIVLEKIEKDEEIADLIWESAEFLKIDVMRIRTDYWSLKKQQKKKVGDRNRT